MPAYLFDLNHVSALFDQQPKVIERLRRVGDAQLRACAITCGEFEGGLQMTDAGCTDRAKRLQYRRWFQEKFIDNGCDVTVATRIYYAKIIEAILKAHPKTKKKQKTERYLVETLGIDVNDLWMAACALEHGFVLVTRDGMDKIRAAVESYGLKIENWIDDPI